MIRRNLAFDQLKGILILLVVVGHVALGSIDENIIRQIIYFFHMPLFLALTGFFVKKNTLYLSIKNILLKYKDRLIIPFVFALLFYMVIQNYHQPLIMWFKFIFNPYPWYHLWYIPAVLLFIVYLKFLINSHYIIRWLLGFIFVCITIFFESYVQWDLSNNLWYKYLGDKRFYYFFSYFAFGFLLASYINIKKFIIPLIGIIIIGCVFYNLSWSYLVRGGGKFLINIGIIGMAIYFCTKTSVLNMKPIMTMNWLAKIGRVSLPIYLWHVFPIGIVKLMDLSDGLYYICSLVIFVAFIPLVIYLENKNSYINRLFYGRV